MFRPSLFLLGFAAFFESSLCAQEFLVDERFSVSPAISPGLVKHPVMATLDDRGRLFVAENAGVNLDKAGLLKELPNSIRLLEDTDKDGVFDKASLFADQLTFPQGALWVYDSLYVMSPPSLWRFADEDGDGRAEVREELATGFDFTGNAADVHGPFLHPNGRLYWCHGRKGFAIPDNDTGQIVEQGKSSRIWSSQLSGGEVEWFAGGGMDNPVEIDFTDEGEILGTVNLFYGRPRGDTLVHWIHGGVYPRHDQGQVLADFRRTGDLLPHVHNFGHVAVSGMCRYRSGKLDPAWADGWLVTHFNTAEITLTKAQQKGASYEATETSAIFRALKPDSHFTDVLEDRNGDLLVIDTGGWFRNGCPTSQVAKPDVAGTIYRIARKEAPYQAPNIPDWNRLTAEQVSHFLGGEEDWLRERAITELAVRGAPAMPELERILVGGQAATEARIDAVWTLARMKFSESTDLILGTLADPEAKVRQTACNALSVTRTWQIVAANQPAERAIELERNETLTGALAGIVRGDEPAVARAAAAALGRMGEGRAIGSLVGRLGRSEGDPFLEHALIYALIEIDDFARTREGLSSSDPAIVRGTLLALDGMPSSKLEVLDVLAHLEAEDPRLRECALELATLHPEWDAALANAFFTWHGALDERRQSLLAGLIPAFSTSPPIIDFLTSLVSSEDASHRKVGLELISRCPNLPFQEDWRPLFETVLAPGGNDALTDLALSALRSTGTKHLDALLQGICQDNKNAPERRLAAAEALARPKQPLPAPAFEMAEAMLKPDSPPELRGRSLALLGGAALSPAQRDRLVTALPGFGPLEWTAFPDLFRQFDSAEQAAQAVDSLISGPALGSLDAAVLRARFKPFPDALTKIEARLAELSAERQARSEDIDGHLQGIAQADVARGEKVFQTGKGACLACHLVGEVGGRIGPDLSLIGRIRTPRDLLESILYPSESIARDFDTYEVVLKNGGGTRQGLVESQSSRGLELVSIAGHREEIPHAGISAVRRVPISLMPSGLEQTLTREELWDLVAYLLSRK